ncbi:MAG: hypothetical protein ABSB23_00280 [Bryobacteraceae bacterium]|jgi:hypothetical protein
MALDSRWWVISRLGDVPLKWPRQFPVSPSIACNPFQVNPVARQGHSATEHGFIPIRVFVVKPVRKAPFIEGAELLHIDSVPLKQCQKVSQCVLINSGLEDSNEQRVAFSFNVQDARQLLEPFEESVFV